MLQGNGEGLDVAGGCDMSQLRLEECALCTHTLGFSGSEALYIQLKELRRGCLSTCIMNNI